MSQSWRTGQWRETANAATWAEGVATRRPAEMTLELMRTVLDDVVLVSDDELRRACRLILEHTHNIAEGAVPPPWQPLSKLAISGWEDCRRHHFGGQSQPGPAP